MDRAGDIANPRSLGPRKEQNGNILGPRSPRRTQSQTDAIAEKLVQMLDSPEHRNFFLRAAWRLSEARLMDLANRAINSGYDSPRAYFIKAVKKDKNYYAREKI